MVRWGCFWVCLGVFAGWRGLAGGEGFGGIEAQWVGGLVDGQQARAIRCQIALGGGQLGVAEQFLHRP